MSDELLFHSKPQSGNPFPTYHVKQLGDKTPGRTIILPLIRQDLLVSAKYAQECHRLTYPEEHPD